MFGEVLEEIRQRLGPAPRGTALSRFGQRIGAPFWLPWGDDLREVFRRQGLLFREGRVAWGALVQANMLLFEPGPHDHPGMVVYSEDPYFDDRPYQLVKVARRLQGLKGTTPADPEERRLAEIITDEMERGMGGKVPRSCAGGRDVRSTSLMFFRRHLPGRVLRGGWYPLLIHPATPAVMVVPSKYWPIELTRLWSEGGELE